jgi:hypothetical protein
MMAENRRAKKCGGIRGRVAELILLSGTHFQDN